MEGNAEQFKKKARELEVVATICKENPEEVLEDIAVSIEKTNKITTSLHSQDKNVDPYLLWWNGFLKVWSYKCFFRWIDKHKDSKDYELMKNDWYVFEILWAVGCDMVRFTRSNELTEGLSTFIARKPPSKVDTDEIWRWHNESMKQLNDSLLKMIDIFKGKQRQAFEKVFEELKDYDRASIVGKLKRLLSAYI